jgi:hypothetical protein
MQRKLPVVGAHYLFRDRIYRVETVSSGTDIIVVKELESGKQYETPYSTFAYGYERVFKVGRVADFLGRSSRSIYRYEQRGLIKKQKMYPVGNGRALRFYRLDDVLEIHELVSELHQGRPRKDGRIVNNTLPDATTLRMELRERYGR